MRLYSTPESAQMGEVSVFAIIETLLAITLMFYLSSHLNTLKWLAVAMCVAPILLLRTESSINLGKRWAKRWAARLRYTRRCLESIARRNVQSATLSIGNRTATFVVTISTLVAPAVVIFLFLAPLGIAAIRVAATVVGLRQDATHIAQAIVKNWGRVIFAEDLCRPPEVVPGYQGRSLLFLFEKESERPRGWAWLSPSTLQNALFVRTILYGPALLYRWSLKATSIIYAPLVFVLHSTLRSVGGLRAELELIKRSDLARIGTIYGAIFVVAFLLKLVCMMKLPGFVDWWNSTPMHRFAALYVAPAEVPRWQLASLANSVLALAVTLGAREALLRIDLGTPWPESAVRRLLGFTSSVRWILTSYSILCTGYVTMNAARGWQWPTLGTKWVPWW